MWRNDLIAINICRGREHGIASYNTYREFCNLTKAYYFEDFGDTINYEGIKLLKKLYK
jgi:peroxidase